MSEKIKVKVKKIKKDNFDDEEDWEYIQKFNFSISTNPDEDNEYLITNKNKDIISTVSADNYNGKFEDIIDIGMPVNIDIQHTYPDIVKVFADMFVAYNASQEEGSNIFEFPIYWAGTISFNDKDMNTEKIDTNINLEEPVGRIKVEIDLGEDIPDIDEYSNEDLQDIVRDAVNNNEYQPVIKSKVVKDIEDDFLNKVSVEKPKKVKKSPPLKPPIPIATDTPHSIVYDINELTKGLQDAKQSLDIETNPEMIKNYTKIIKQINILLKKKEGLCIVDNTQRPFDIKYNDIKTKIDKLEEGGKITNTILSTIKNELKELKVLAITKEDRDKLRIIVPIFNNILQKKKEGLGIVDNTELYEKAKEIVYKQYPKHSAYRSGQLVKKYKEMGGTYSGKKDTDGLTRWFKEEWKDIGSTFGKSRAKDEKMYPVYRPTKRITKDTPLTPEEIKPSNLKKQVKLKQEIKGTSNLPPFLPLEPVEISGAGIEQYSNPKIVFKKAKEYLGKNIEINISTKKDKKYMVKNPDGKWVHFGQMGAEDFTKHKDEKRRKNYLTRSANIKGNWKDDKYSPNNLSRNLLW